MVAVPRSLPPAPSPHQQQPLSSPSSRRRISTIVGVQQPSATQPPAAAECLRSAATAQRRCSQRSTAAARAVAAAAAAEAGLQTAAAPADKQQQQQQQQQRAVSEARRVLRALGTYAPAGLDDGPASLAKVLPYDAHEVQQALQHASRQLLEALPLQQLANLGAALAAAGHCDAQFMLLLGDVAAARLAGGAAAATEHKAGLAAFRSLAWLAIGFARLGQLHPQLMQQVALRGAELLRRRPMAFSKPAHGRQLALLAGSYAALQLYPPQLFRALTEHLKQQRHVLQLLGPREAMLLLWALARVRHRDPATELLLVQRAATRVGQLDCQGLAHAYAQCGAVGITAPPLLAALRKSARQRLHTMQPEQLLALLAALAALGQQDSLFLDEIAKAVHNKAANFAADQLSASLSALAALRYRNPWLLERLSKVLVSRRLNKAPFLSPDGLVALLQACGRLQHHNMLLLGHLAAVAADAQVPRCCERQLATLLQSCVDLRFQQPQLLQAAAVRLLELATQQQQKQQQLQHQQQQQQQQHSGARLAGLIQAAHSLALLPSPAGSTAERLVLPAAAMAIAAQALAPPVREQEPPAPLSCADAAQLLVALQCITADLQQQQQQQQQVAAPLLADVIQQLLVLQPAAQQLVHTAAAGTAAGWAVSPGSSSGGDGPAEQQPLLPGSHQLLQAMQLTWLLEAASNQQPQHQQQPGTAAWRLGLADDAVQALVALQQTQQQQQQQRMAQMRTAITRPLQQQQAATVAELHVGHQLPDSPVVLPLAITWSSSQQRLPDEAAQQQQQQLLQAPTVVDVPAAALAAPTGSRRGRAQQQQQQRLLPSSVADMLGACAQLGRPVAVFLEADDDDEGASSSSSSTVAPAGPLPGWCTRNPPRRVMPAAELWQRGLAAAGGWAVLVVRVLTADGGGGDGDED